MSSDIDLGLIDDDPNAATRNQAALKRVEVAIRRHCDCNLLLSLDGIALLSDEAKIKSEMLRLKKAIEQKSQEVEKGTAC